MKGHWNRQHRIAISAVAAVTMVAVATPSAAWADALRSLGTHVKGAGFQPVYPIATDLQPGMVYLEKKGTGGEVVRDFLCESMFENHIPKISDALLASIASDNMNDTKASLSLLPGLFKSEANAAAKLSQAGVEKGTLSFGDTKISTLQTVVSAKGKRRTISQDCMGVISPLFNGKGKTDRKIFLIARTLSAGEISYDMHVRKDSEAGLEAALKNIFGLNFGYKKVGDNVAKISFRASAPESRMVVGYNATQIKNLKQDTQISDSIVATVAGDEVPVTEEPVTLILTRTR